MTEMRKIHVLGACVAILAFCMVAVSASATLWLVGGVTPSKETLANSHGHLSVIHTGGLIGNFKIECTVLLIGLVGPERLDLVTEVEGLHGERGTVKCKYTEIGECGKAVGEEVNVKEVNLPWHTLLLLETTVTLDHFLNESGKVPGYEVTCTKSGLKGSCTGEELRRFVKNGVNGAVFKFERLDKSSCTDFGEALIEGEEEVLGATVS